MAVNESRSMNWDLAEGLTDGVVKKINQNVGGDISDLSWNQMVIDHLAQDLYGYYGGEAVVQAVARRQTSI